MNLIFYYCPITCSVVTHMALTESGANFDVRLVNLRRGAHRSPEYLRMNPKHQVPVLVIDSEPLTENVAILLWIARHFPRAQLMPSDDTDEFKAIALMAWCDSGIHPHLTANMLPERYCDLPSSEDAVRRAAHKVLREKYQVAEDLLAGREWFFEHFTLPDAFFFWCFRQGIKCKVDMSEFPNCHGHFERVSQRAGTQKVLAFEEQSLLELTKVS